MKVLPPIQTARIFTYISVKIVFFNCIFILDHGVCVVYSSLLIETFLIKTTNFFYTNN